MTNVLVEGGGQVLGSFLDEGQVDAVEVFIAPILEGGDHARTAVRGRGVSLMRDAARLRGRRSFPGRRRRARPWMVAPTLARAGGLDRGRVTLTMPDGRALQSR